MNEDMYYVFVDSFKGVYSYKNVDTGYESAIYESESETDVINFMERYRKRYINESVMLLTNPPQYKISFPKEGDYLDFENRCWWVCTSYVHGIKEKWEKVKKAKPLGTEVHYKKMVDSEKMGNNVDTIILIKKVIESTDFDDAHKIMFIKALLEEGLK